VRASSVLHHVDNWGQGKAGAAASGGAVTAGATVALHCLADCAATAASTEWVEDMVSCFQLHDNADGRARIS
jgi:hypothetical protein